MEGTCFCAVTNSSNHLRGRWKRINQEYTKAVILVQEQKAESKKTSKVIPETQGSEDELEFTVEGKLSNSFLVSKSLSECLFTLNKPRLSGIFSVAFFPELVTRESYTRKR